MADLINILGKPELFNPNANQYIFGKQFDHAGMTFFVPDTKKFSLLFASGDGLNGIVNQQAGGFIYDHNIDTFKFQINGLDKVSINQAGELTAIKFIGDGSGLTGLVTFSSTDDLVEGVSNLYYTNSRADGRIALQKGAANGLATLGPDSKIPSSQLPSIAITDTFVIGSQAAMLALTAEVGDVAVRTDLNKTFILQNSPASTLSNWIELSSAGSVTSVNGYSGNVVLATGDIAESGSNYYYTTGRFNTDFASKSTDDLNEGSTNKYYHTSLFVNDFNARVAGSVGTLPYFTTANELGDSPVFITGGGFFADVNGISGKTDGSTALGSSSRRFASLYLGNQIDFTAGQDLSVSENGTQRLLLKSSTGNLILGNAADNGSKVQIKGTNSSSLDIGDSTSFVDRVSLLTGSSNTDPFFALGRTTTEAEIAISSASGNWSNLSAAGDLIIRSDNGSLILTAKNSSGHIKFGTGASDAERMRITSSGRVLIGSTTDDGSNRLQVTGTTRFNNRVGMGVDSTSTYFISQLSSGLVSSLQTGMNLSNSFDSTVATNTIRQLDIQNVLYGGGPVTSAVGIRVNGTVVAGSTIGTDHGILITDIVGGVVNYAIKTGLGKVSLGDVVEVEAASISGKTDGTTNLGSSSRRFATLFMASTIDIASGSSLQIGHASNDLVVHSSGRVLIGTGTDDGTNKLQVNGQVKVTMSGGVTSSLISAGGFLTHELLTHSAGIAVDIEMGRAALEGLLGVAETAGRYSNYAVAGDFALVSRNGNLILSAQTATADIYLSTKASDIARIVIKSGGNVLIGSTTDDASNKLQVTGDMKVNGAMTSSDFSVTNASNSLKLQMFSGSSSAHTFINLGRTAQDALIGIAEISARFSDVAVAGDLAIMSRTGHLIMSAQNGSSDIKFTTGSSDTVKMMIKNSGRVLVGTTTDDGVNKLQISGTVKLTVSSATAEFGTSGVLDKLELLSGSSSDHMSLRLGRTSQEATFGVAATSGNFSNISLAGDAVLRADVGNLILSAKNATNHIKFSTGSTDSEKMRLTNSGRLLISTTTDDGVNILQVAGSTKFTSGPGGSGSLTHNDDTLTLFSTSTSNVISLRVGRGSLDLLLGVNTSGNYADDSDQTNGTVFLQSRSGNLVISSRTVSGHIKFTTETPTTEKMRLTSAGRLLIGTTTDDGVNKLQVNGGVVFASGLTLNTNNDVSTVGNLPTWIEFTVTHAMLQFASLTNDIELFSLPAGYVIHAVKIKHSIAFTGTGITGYTLSLGIVGNLTKYTSAFDVFQSVGGTVQQLSDTVQTENNDAVTSIRLAATSVGANLDQSTAGTVKIKVLVSNAHV